MKAMVLAAGLGTRLRPLTNDRPKALVEVAGRTMLEITLERLRAFAVHDVIINTHHFANLIPAFLKQHDNFGMHIEISHEDLLLDTGGGLKNAEWFFLQDGKDGPPFLLHNVDVISTIDLARMVQSHQQENALATLAVQARPTSRPLLFDNDGQLRSRGSKDALPAQEGMQALAFSGIHVLSPRIFPLLSETGAFSIIDVYLRLAARGEKIRAFRADQYEWHDLGTPENVTAAARAFAPQPDQTF